MNAVILIGYLGSRPVPVGADGERGFVVVTLREADGRRVDRHLITVAGDTSVDLADVSPGATVYVEGRLGSCAGSDRVSVVARHAWMVDPPPPPSTRAAAPIATHASPREHFRTGHPRRIAVNTPEERVVWVRPTTVRPARRRLSPDEFGRAGDGPGESRAAGANRSPRALKQRSRLPGHPQRRQQPAITTDPAAHPP